MTFNACEKARIILQEARLISADHFLDNSPGSAAISELPLPPSNREQRGLNRVGKKNWIQFFLSFEGGQHNNET
jgi:hypothetical protein